MITTYLRDRIHRAAVECRLSALHQRSIDRDLIAEDWPVLAATLDAASQSHRGAPLAELAAELRAEVRS